MRVSARLYVGLVAIGLATASCEAPAQPQSSLSRPQPPQAAAPKRITAAIAGDVGDLSPGASAPGADAFLELINAGLTHIDDRRSPRPQLAEVVPTIENGLWKLLPDGRMETTWTMKQNARWHDGQPVSSFDLLFTLRIGKDPELPAFGHIAFDSIESAETPDWRTIVVKWKRPYVEADTLLSRSLAPPLPAHILGKTYDDDKENFSIVPYWSEEYVGAGPYRIAQWVRGSHVLLEANDHYVLGRPKIDAIELRFIPDSNTLMANILAGAVELTLGRNLDLDEALQVRDQWREGRMDIGFKSWIAVFPQFVNPNPPVIADVRFRRALLLAIDRQELADTIQAGLVPVAHSYINPSEPEYQDIEGEVVGYNYDPRKAQEMIEALGYTRAADGTFRGAENQRLAVELRTIGVTAQKAIFAVADYWRRVGVPTEPVSIPAARTRDNEYRATFPGFQIFQNPNDLNGLIRFHSSRAALPENNFRILDNHSRYLNPQLDALIQQFFSTIPRAERVSILGQIVHHISDQLNVMGLYYGVEPTMIHNRLRNVSARKVQTSVQSWNAHEWDVAS